MNVLFLRPQPAIRSLKYALGFKSVGVDIRILHGYTSRTLTELYGHGDECFEKFIKLDPKDLQEEIREIVISYNIDLTHSQNAPDFLTVSAIRSVDDVPIIHDNQDAISLRETPYYPGADVEKQLVNERMANEGFCVRIHVTEEMMAYIQLASQRAQNDSIKEPSE